MAADKLEQLNELLLINYWGKEEGRPEASLLPNSTSMCALVGLATPRTIRGFLAGRPTQTTSPATPTLTSPNPGICGSPGLRSKGLPQVREASHLN